MPSDLGETCPVDFSENIGGHPPIPMVVRAVWVWLKIKQEGQTAGFGPCFHLPGFPFGTGFLSHSHFKEGNPPKDQKVISPVDGCEIHPTHHEIKPWVETTCLLVFTGDLSFQQHCTQHLFRCYHLYTFTLLPLRSLPSRVSWVVQDFVHSQVYTGFSPPTVMSPQ